VKEQVEQIELLNQRLTDEYGLDTSTGQPIFRIVWANDQLEKRLVTETDLGVQLMYPEVLEMKKYSYLKDVYVLERLVEIDERELPGIKLSYEPLWVYKDAANNPLPPIWDATKFIVDTLYAALGRKSLRKYVEDTSQEAKDARIDKIQEELFGNETEVTDALTYREGIVVPSSKTRES